MSRFVSRNSDGLASRQHSDSDSLSQQDIHGDADDVENCEQEPFIFLARKSSSMIEIMKQAYCMFRERTISK